MRVTTTRTITLTVGVLAAGAVLTATAGTATATATPHAAAGHAPVVIAGDGRAVRPAALALDDASPVAGYAADLSQFTSPKHWRVTETFVVPTVRCTARTTNVLYVQQYLQGTDRAGTTIVDYAYVLVSCQGTTPTYQLFARATGTAQDGVFAATAPGDDVQIVLDATGRAETSTVTDVTTGAVASQTGTGFAAATFTQSSVQGGDAHSVFPVFRRVHFTKLLAVGRSLPSLNPFRFDATDAAGDVEIQAQPFDANGKGFVAQYLGNFSPTP